MGEKVGEETICGDVADELVSVVEPQDERTFINKRQATAHIVNKPDRRFQLKFQFFIRPSSPIPTN
jgi:hypothetical protein